MSVDTHFYPLGSCTMKYNSKRNERMAALPGIADLHPLQADDTIQGLLQLLFDLQQMLAEISGLPAVSLQPAAGAHGELAALMVAAAYFRHQNLHRTKVLAPDSAHGTNPASARMAGFDFLTVKSAAGGMVDLDDLRTKLDDQIAVFMITNPSTLGLFDQQVPQIARLVHERGGLIYLDGANMNATLGITRPGDFGADMMHYNPHKTFSGPHGGGGPGAGPICVAEKLGPYLPTPIVVREEGSGFRVQRSAEQQGTGDRGQETAKNRSMSNPQSTVQTSHSSSLNPEPRTLNPYFHLDYDRPHSIGRVRSFFGNVGVLVRAYCYIRTHGPDGLKAIAENAVLNANYLMSRVKHILPVPQGDRCMHEFVATAAPLKKKNGVSAMDLAKRLLDFGFHAPTVYFPLTVPEAMMIEPTETESKETLDAFAETLFRITEESPELLHQAPHSTLISRPDEVRAARQPVMKWTVGNVE